MPKVVEEKNEEETKTSLPENVPYTERKSLIEIIFERETPLTFILLSLMILWIGIIIGFLLHQERHFTKTRREILAF